jgi:hypothetical protein
VYGDKSESILSVELSDCFDSSLKRKLFKFNSNNTILSLQISPLKGLPRKVVHKSISNRQTPSKLESPVYLRKKKSLLSAVKRANIVKQNTSIHFFPFADLATQGLVSNVFANTD